MSVPVAVRRCGYRVCSRQAVASTQLRCSQRPNRASLHSTSSKNGTIVPGPEVRKHMYIHSQSSFHEYFSANDSIDRGWLKNGLLATWRTAARPSQLQLRHSSVADSKISECDKGSLIDTELDKKETSQSVTASVPAIESELEHVLPHRRRLLRKSRAGSVQPTKEEKSAQDNEQLPLDASSQLTTAASAMPENATLRRKFATYLSLSKPRLSFLIILTTTSAYSLYPIPEILSSTTNVVDATTTLSTSTLTLLFLTTGTFLSCASANAFNMLFESKYDALMTRTRNRPLVRKLISHRAALVFALVCGTSGLLLLEFGTNPTVAALSGLNILLYGFLYTPMKRISVANTWIGAIVGGIPPLMGWAAAAGQAATSEHHSWKDLLFAEDSSGGWLLAALLFAWQFPHFNSLSHTIRDDYRNAGHQMLAWVNPARNARVALRYSVAMFPICAGLYWAEIVNPGFLVVSTICNAWMLKQAIRFWKFQGAKGSARGLFWASVWQLPLVLVGALVCKTGIWDGFFEKEAQSIYDPDSASDVIEDEELAMKASSTLMRHTTDERAINMAMLGFKRPS